MSEKKHLMIGMPDSGKTTLLAALFHVVESSQIESSLQLVDLSGNRDYLVEIRDKWLGCVKMDRTKFGEDKMVELKLSDPITGEVIELILPDISGESFREQWEKRVSTKTFDELAYQTDGILFFIHPNTIKEAVRINKSKLIANILAEDLDGEVDDKMSTETINVTEQISPENGPINEITYVTAAKKPLNEFEEKNPKLENLEQTEWNNKFAPTQVKLIEILQFLLREPDIYPLSHIAIIISAWDLLKDEYKSPNEWLAKRMPMFDQFLRANSDIITSKLFGISAQGGELSKDQEENRDLLLKQSDRIIVVTDIPNEYDEHDITAPIKWLMHNCK